MAQYSIRIPTQEQLTLSQRVALEYPGPIALSGGPGTGKSVVSLIRYIRKRQQGENVLLLTYTSTLVRYFQAACALESQDIKNHIGASLRNKPYRNYYDEIIIDEAQDLVPDYYKNIKQCANAISYGSDSSQILYPEHCTKDDEFRKIFSNHLCHLNKNFRNTKGIMEFVKRCFPMANISDANIKSIKTIGDKPVLHVVDSDSQQDRIILEILKAFNEPGHNIAILVPWQKHVDYFKDVVSGYTNDYSWYYNEGNTGNCGSIKNIHITTFKSCKGLEFDTVVIPNFDMFPRICGKFFVEWNDYYVACTRAKMNLHLISNSPYPDLSGVVDYDDRHSINQPMPTSKSINYANIGSDDDLPF